MELIMIVAGLLLLDILAMRFGVDSRILDVRERHEWWPGHEALRDVVALSHQAQLHYEAEVQRLASLASARRPSFRVRLAHGLLALAERIEPAPAPARQ